MSGSKNKKYSAEFIESSVRLAKEGEGSIAQTARNLGINPNTLYGCSLGLSIILCKIPIYHLNPTIKFDHKMSHSKTPIWDRHSPFSRNIIYCQV
jgi:hypothetical protein